MSNVPINAFLSLSLVPGGREEAAEEAEAAVQQESRGVGVAAVVQGQLLRGQQQRAQQARHIQYLLPLFSG